MGVAKVRQRPSEDAASPGDGNMKAQQKRAAAAAAPADLTLNPYPDLLAWLSPPAAC
jgi:hypothetical protein